MIGKLTFSLLLLGSLSVSAQQSQKKLDDILPVRGLAISAPQPSYVDSFVLFIENELAPRQVNLLILRVDNNYQFQTHPELRDSIALSFEDVGKIVDACRRHQIRVIPQINLLGHQSWGNKTGKLLTIYPEFDETPEITMPAVYQWPNADSLYCKSYCPLHPALHKVIFDVIDELCDVFRTSAFHAGMDEVFYIASKNCPRCSGKDPARLFADEVTRIHDHLARSNRELWIWGDRLIDGASSGVGMWEGSMNQTYPAIDWIPRDVVICDWHYERPDRTAPNFVSRGLRVATSTWRNPSIAIAQLRDMLTFRQEANRKTKSKYLGMIQTVWSKPQAFINGFYSNEKDPVTGDNTAWNCFRQLFDAINKLN